MNTKTMQICQTAIMMAAVFVVTRFIQIPIPLGYFNIGNCVILLFCIMIDSPYGILGGSIGSALADLTSYPVYTMPTLLIKALMPIVFYMIVGKQKNKSAYVLATAVSTLIPLFGYTLTGAVLAGSFSAGLMQFPGLLLEYVANLMIFAVLYTPVLAISKRFKAMAF